MIRPSIVAVVALVLAASHARADEKAPSYVKEVRPFLNKYCVECHKTGQKKGGANLESYESIRKGGKNGRALLVAGKPDESRIVTCTEGTSKPVMPPKKAKAKPTDKEVAMLRAWVAAGAKDDTPADTRLKAKPVRSDLGAGVAQRLIRSDTTKGFMSPPLSHSSGHLFTYATPLSELGIVHKANEVTALWHKGSHTREG